jgi:glutaminase
MNRALSLSPVQQYLERLHAELLPMQGGELASYIPELTRADPNWLGIALVTVDGHVYQAGDSREPFTVQSISKAITYGLALEDRGLEQLLAKVDVEPSGEAFNSISLEPDSGRPLNPMINAGAIATTGMVAAEPGRAPMQRILDSFARYTGHDMTVDEAVYRSESDTGHRNRAIAHLLYGYGILERAPEDVVDLYFRQCSILVTARDLALMGACLANSGVNPVTGIKALRSDLVGKVLSVMSTCGMYDYSGGWIFNVGMPAKSGVGGGIMAVLPGQFGLGVFSPLLDAKGNSVRGIEACKRLSNDFKLHLFNVAHATSEAVVRQHYDCTRPHSRRRRDAIQMAVLAEHGRRIRVYELQGELLFGSTESVALALLTELEQADYLIVDLRRLLGMDQASATLLGHLCERAAADQKRLFFCGTSHLYPFRRHLQKRDVTAQTPGWLSFDETERALEWCEGVLIGEEGLPQTSADGSDLCRQYLCSGLTETEIETVRKAGSERRFAAGEQIVRAGEPADCLYFILAGEAEVWVSAASSVANSRRLRLSILAPGTVFGEIGLLNGQQRTANVSAISELHCLQLPFDALDETIRNQMLANMARHFAEMLKDNAELVQHLA